MNLDLTEDQIQIRDAVRELCREEFAPYAAPATSIALKSPGSRRSTIPTPSRPISTWPHPPTTMPASAASPARLPAVRLLANTIPMSSPGSSTTPNTMPA